jgi:UPF0716 protein FxsA
MPVWLFLIAVLAFPLAEALSIVWVAGRIGWWTLVWLAATFAGGLALIRFERLAFASRMTFSLQRGQSPFRALFNSTRLFIAGGLLMSPGLFTDVMALVLLLFPGTWRRPFLQRYEAANDEVIEGEFRRESGVISDRFPRRDI